MRFEISTVPLNIFAALRLTEGLYFLFLPIQGLNFFVTDYEKNDLLVTNDGLAIFEVIRMF